MALARFGKALCAKAASLAGSGEVGDLILMRQVAVCPVSPADRIVLGIGIVVVALAAAEFVASSQHDRAG